MLELHIDEGMPTSGFEQGNWSDYLGENESTNNCYTYMLGITKQKDGTPFRENGLNPGEMGGSSIRISWLLDASFVDMLIQNRVNSVDGIRLYPIAEGAVAREGFYKVALVMRKNWDIHWYRQNPDGSWSHKAGISPVRFEDWSGNSIQNPRLSDLGVYDEFVNFYELENLMYSKA